MKLDERKNQIENLLKELREATESENLEVAKTKEEELRKAKELFEIEKKAEEEQRKLDDMNKNIAPRKDDVKMDYKTEIRNVVRVLTGKATAEQRATVKEGDNGAILPDQFINEFEVLREGYPSLKEYCHVIPVTSSSGKMPTSTTGQNTLSNLSEDTEIPEGAISNNRIEYAVKDYGKIIPVTNNMLEDDVVNLVDNVIKPDFAEASVTKENEEILKAVKAVATKVTSATDYEDVAKAMDSVVPNAKANIVTITNVDGYVYLKNLKDGEGRPLNLVTVVNGVDYFNGKPLITLSNEAVSASATTKYIFYVANLKEAVKFFDRKQIEIAKSTDAGFTKNNTIYRIIERFDAKQGSGRSVKSIEFAKATA